MNHIPSCLNSVSAHSRPVIYSHHHKNSDPLSFSSTPIMKMHLSYRPSICTCGDGRTKVHHQQNQQRWVRKALVLLLLLFVLYRVLKRPAPRLTMTNEEWDSYIQNHPYEAPGPNDVRAPCPFLNTFANHGILPRSGKNITYGQYYKAMTLVGTADWATVAFLNPVFYIYKEIDPAQSTWSDLRQADHISLNQLGQHNLIEHDISLTRMDISDQPDFSRPNVERVQEIVTLASANKTSLKKLNVRHVGDFRRVKWREAMQKPMAGYHFGAFYQFASAVECVLLLDYLGHNHSISLAHLDSFVVHERIPKDWYPLEKPLTNWQLFSRTRSCLLAVRKSKA